MTTEMFGAPYGIQQAEQGINQNVLSGLKAQQILGELAMQPTEQRLKEAQARLYGSEAAEREAKISDLQQMDRIAKEAAARRRLVADKNARGEIATVEDLPPGGLVGERSQADPVEEFLRIAEDNGISEIRLAPLRKEASLIRQQEAASANHRSNQIVHQLTAQEKIADTIGSLAQGALAQPEMYPLIRAEAVRRGVPQMVFPETFSPEMMQTYVDASLKTKDKIELNRKTEQDTAHRKLWKSMESKNAVNERLAGARYNLVDEQYQLLKKNAGEASPEVKDLRVERRLASIAKRKASERKEFPPAPLSPEDREPGQKYTAANGAKFLWTKDPVTGKFVAVQLAPPPGTRAAAAISAVPGGSSRNTTDDENEDEDEED